VLLEGDVVRYVGASGVYLSQVEVNFGDTGVVAITTNHHKSMTTVRLFKSPDNLVSLPSVFWYRLT
jgi:hypothetical protein